ncbi:MAG: hypothetical protein OEV40_29540, partial [Acidimicrobiia bacterium]|nr:hypothetical protein [Acidimicrobiia bacterium]
GRHVEALTTIPGVVPRLIDLDPGCRFAGRCQARIEAGLEVCTETEPELIELDPGHRARCWLHADRPATTAGLAASTEPAAGAIDD